MTRPTGHRNWDDRERRKPSIVRWGIGSYTYGWASGTYGASYAAPGARRLSALELIERAAAERCRVVQLSVLPDILSIEVEELRALAQRAEQHGLQVETGTSGTDPEHLRAYLRASVMLGAGTVRTIIRGEGKTLERAGEDLSEVAAVYEREGVRIAIENFEAAPSEELAGLIRKIGSPAIGACIDTVNNLGRGEGTEEVLTALLPSVFCVHLKDFVSTRSQADSGFEITGVPLGTGRLPAKRVVSAVLAANPEVSVILEQWIPFQGTREATIAEENRWARLSIDYLHDLVGELEPAV